MTVDTQTNKITYIGNGVATEFAIPFPFLKKEHLNVYQLLNDIQTTRTDWEVVSCNIVFKKAPSIGAQIVIMRQVPFTQETDYKDNEILSAETLEQSFDLLTMQVQQLKEKADRAVTVDVFDCTEASELLPSINASVSSAAQYAAISTNQAQAAVSSANLAESQALLAQQSAALAESTVSTKANITGNNIIDKNLFIQNIGAIQAPTNENQIGYWTCSSNGTLPAGGTWAYFYIGFSGSATFHQSRAGVAAGGSFIDTNSYSAMLCWKIG